MSSTLDSLNTSQKEAAETIQGPVLVIAGAGTGKTRALTHRIAHMVSSQGINPWNILAVTFTNKAAGEMKKRIEQLIADPEKVPKWIGTFHSICARILRTEIHHLDFTSSYTIYDTDDQKKLMREVISDLKIDDKRITPQGMLARISGAKNELIGHEKFAAQADDYMTEIAAKCYPLYQHYLKEHNAVDFDDLIMHTVTLFQKFPEVLDKYQEQWKYVLIDEYQDTNHAQYTLVRSLAEKYRNLCVVGDDWQGIYGWRGADIRNILSFESDYPEAKVIKLEQNYRSTQRILDAAQNIIDRNVDRTDKTLWTEAGDGEKLRVIEAFDERHEGARITELVSASGSNLSENVILYRTNAQSRAIEEAFLHAGIPYKIVGGVKFYERREIKDLLAYLNLIVNPADRVSLLRIINVPSRKIGKQAIAHIKNYADQHDIVFHEALAKGDSISTLTPQAKRGTKAFQKLLNILREESKKSVVSELIEKLLDLADYRMYLLDGTTEGEDRYQNVQELYTVAKKYDNLPPEESLQSFLQEVALVTDLDQVEAEENAATLMTMHSAKGLEFDHVIIAGMEENLFPHIRSQSDPEALEEERRLCYVGITRARETVTLITAKQRTIFGNVQVNIPSRFLTDIHADLVEVEGKLGDSDEPDFNSGMESIGTATMRVERKPLPKEPAPYNDGDKVNHPTFGNGTVVSVSGDIVSIAFEKKGVKKFMATVAPLEIIK